MKHRFRPSLLFLGIALLAGCEVAVAPEAPPPNTDIAERSAASLQAEERYARLQEDLLTRGLLRRDGGGPDTPFSRRDLVENFVRIALFDEYDLRGGRPVARETPSPLHRWADPVRVSVQFGASVPTDQRTQDLNSVESYLARLHRITGHDLSLATNRVNFHILFLNEDERAPYAQTLREMAPDLTEQHIQTALRMDRGELCQVVSFSSGDTPGEYNSAIVVIRGEHPDLLRLSCIHEEIAQGLGLPNDSPAARPSIFNDDEEFGLLTRHDELLLQILYDSRLPVGINADEARPIIEEIVAELLGGEA